MYHYHHFPTDIAPWHIFRSSLSPPGITRSSIAAILLFLLLGLVVSSESWGQERVLPVDTTITSSAQVTINGSRVPYNVTIGTQPVWGDDGNPIAALLYTFYQRSDVVHDNPHSILDVADIVYINPVNTGFSRIIGDADPKQFFGVNEDVKYLAAWLENFVSRNSRWESPKFLIGESYGTTRVSGLAGALLPSC